MALVLGIPNASAQAPAPSWRSAARAALAFGHAEGQLAGLRRFAIKAAPRTKKDADAVLDDLDRRAQRARDAYLAVEQYSSPFWSAASAIRLGDTFLCQADKITAIPIPPPLAAAVQSLPPSVLSQYIEVLHGLVRPLHDQAARQWERAAAIEDASGWVIRRAGERLAGTSLPDC